MRLTTKCAIGATAALACWPGMALGQGGPVPVRGPELVVGVLDHGVNLRGDPGPGFIQGGTGEGGTVDIEAMWRSKPVPSALSGRVYAKLQLNTGGRTNFAVVGAAWRQHVLRRRVYGQIGIGLAVHDGYLKTPDPFEPGIGNAEAQRRFAIYSRNADLGSRVLFNPNLSLGVRLGRRWAAELAFEHYSNATLFSDTNEGIEMLGVRLVRTLGRRR